MAQKVGRHTVDQSVSDELSVLLHQVIDVTKNATKKSSVLSAFVF